MGKQYNKVIKRRRRKAYLERKKARAKAGIGRQIPTRGKDAEGAKPAAKKAAKKPAAKKAAAAEAAPAAES